jgi:hypothetical protein
MLTPKHTELCIEFDCLGEGLVARGIATLVPHNASFFKKISYGLAVLEGLVAQLCGRKFPGENVNAGKDRKPRGRRSKRTI